MDTLTETTRRILRTQSPAVLLPLIEGQHTQIAILEETAAEQEFKLQNIRDQRDSLQEELADLREDLQAQPVTAPAGELAVKLRGQADASIEFEASTCRGDGFPIWVNARDTRQVALSLYLATDDVRELAAKLVTLADAIDTEDK